MTSFELRACQQYWMFSNCFVGNIIKEKNCCDSDWKENFSSPDPQVKKAFSDQNLSSSVVCFHYKNSHFS